MAPVLQSTSNFTLLGMLASTEVVKQVYRQTTRQHVANRQELRRKPKHKDRPSLPGDW